MSKSQQAKTPPRSDPQKPQKSPKYREVDEAKDREERETLSKKLMQDAKDLLDYVAIEMTVGSQMEVTRRKIKELSKICRDENRMIVDLEMQFLDEDKIAKEFAEHEQTVANINTVDNNEIATIIELERKLQSLYAEKEALLKKQRKKK